MSAERAGAVVCSCVVCDHVWELIADELAGKGDVVGCPVCGGWLWRVELAEVVESRRITLQRQTVVSSEPPRPGTDRTDEFAADILHRCRWAQQRNDGHPSPAWSTGEQLAVALVLRDRTHLDEMGYTVQEAAQRVHDGMAAPPTDLGAWLDGIRRVELAEVVESVVGESVGTALKREGVRKGGESGAGPCGHRAREESRSRSHPRP